MASTVLAVTFDVADPPRVARFWADLLRREVVSTVDGLLVPGDGTQLGLRFAPARTDKTGPERVHLHITSTSAADQAGTVQRALALGARHVDVGQRPEEGHVVLADPGDDELCVIEPGNAYLEGCGPLGELACVGSHDVGLFWSRVLGWPLVWDQDGETAVQHPLGGTKLAWGGQPRPAEAPVSRQRLELVTDGDVEREVDRLVALGASRRATDDHGVVTLVDPDGHELRVRRRR